MIFCMIKLNHQQALQDFECFLFQLDPGLFGNSVSSLLMPAELLNLLGMRTGNLPQHIATAFRFMFPLGTRNLLFYVVSFDRHRALQQLLDTTEDINSVDMSEHVTPRLDRRKRSRKDILRQVESIILDFDHTKALSSSITDNIVKSSMNQVDDDTATATSGGKLTVAVQSKPGGSTLFLLNKFVKQRHLTQANPSLDVMEKTEKIEALDLNACPIADLSRPAIRTWNCVGVAVIQP